MPVIFENDDCGWRNSKGMSQMKDFMKRFDLFRYICRKKKKIE